MRHCACNSFKSSLFFRATRVLAFAVVRANVAWSLSIDSLGCVEMMCN